MYLHRPSSIEVLLVHPGGPFWRKRDEGAWSIPKGEPNEGEDLLATALREFREEVGLAPKGDLTDLGWVQQKGGKVVYAWALEAAPGQIISLTSNTFELEWPPRSGTVQTFPEIDRAEFFPLAEAEKKINRTQQIFLERLRKKLGC